MAPRPRIRAAGAVGGIVALVATVLAIGAGTRPAAAAAPSDPPPLVRPSTGYWMAAADGGVFAFGDAQYDGSMGGTRLDQPVVGMAATPSGRGYRMVARDGGMFSFGDAAFYGSMGGHHLNRPVVGMASTPTGQGYWLVATDGGIFAFGDAAFYGSTGDIPLNQPIVAVMATPGGHGYWLVASDGGVFAFGDAAFYGSAGDIRLNQPIVAAAASPDGRGYWLAARDGGIFAFGDARFYGSTGDVKLNEPIVAATSTGTGFGYWLVASDGGVFSFGDARFYGSTGDLRLASPIVAVAPKPDPARVETAIFYYPWYGTPDVDGSWVHWDITGHSPPGDIASDYYPARGVYSSNDRAVLDDQMASIARAGVDTIVVSWWGPGSFEDKALPAVAAAARVAGLNVAAHIEPYDGRTPDTVQRDIDRLSSTLGITDFWIYLSDGPSPEDWQLTTSRFSSFRIMAEGHLASNARTGVFEAYAAKAGFDGIYTYDVLPYAPGDFATVCREARAYGLLCSPSVNPGYDDEATRPGWSSVRSREGGARYDAWWTGAFASGADVVSITSFNEWHEGTQIEPTRPASGRYHGFDGDYGSSPASSPTVYLERTLGWTSALRGAGF
ncbi:MAG TPA: hypothetical protein VHN98_12970 [Acidimicrobiales bacterium]|nr:hypothetical protein [Acidimicrobiales bacterium]